jgi:hypothetical protein
MRARALVGDPVGLIRLLHCMRASPLACQPGRSRIIHFRRLRRDEEILKAPSFVDNDDVVARLDCDLADATIRAWRARSRLSTSHYPLPTTPLLALPLLLRSRAFEPLVHWIDVYWKQRVVFPLMLDLYSYLKSSTRVLASLPFYQSTSSTISQGLKA